MSNQLPPGIVPIEPLLDWESPAVGDAGTVDPSALEGFLADPATLTAAAGWVGVTVASAVLGNGACEALNDRVTPFLAAWRNRHGDTNLADFKRCVLDGLLKEYLDPQQRETLRQAVDEAFKRAEE